MAELREHGLINRTEPYHHTVPFSHRSGERIEPLISLQWFMRMDELAAPAIEVVRSGRVRFTPERYERVYLDWMENIRPWCISRQLWWGHQIPVWYRGDKVYCGVEAPEGDGWERDPDVLDTWFSSALWPFATLGWPEKTPELQAFYPTDTLVTGRDIIFLWVARMIMMGLEFTGEIPFSDVYITSIIQAPDGRRMSKSLGTGIDPIDLIGGGARPPVFRSSRRGWRFPAYGADAVRWGLMAMSSGQDVRFSEDKVAQGQQLTNKLWNAARLILTNVSPDARPALRPSKVEDRWILTRLGRAQAEVDRRIAEFDFSHAALAVYDFVYGELCDWYLELVKPRLRERRRRAVGHAAVGADAHAGAGASAHPVRHRGDLLATSRAPRACSRPGSRAEDVPSDSDAEAALGDVIAAVQALRGWRDAAGVRPGALVPARLVAKGYEQTADHVASAGAPAIHPRRRRSGRPRCPCPAARSRSCPPRTWTSRRRRASARSGGPSWKPRSPAPRRKLANAGFTAKAPPAVVQAERDKLERLRAELDAL